MPALRRVLLLVLTVAVVLGPAAERATGCSCGTSVYSALATSDAAFVGTPTGVQADPVADSVWMFDVDQALRGPVGESAAIAGGGECGIDLPIGVPVGVVASWFEGAYTTGSCSGIWDATVLADAATGLPSPTGAGPIAFFVPAALGDARTAGLDASGTPAAYGFGAGYAEAVAACPGGGTGFELVGDTETTTLETRSFVTWDVERRVEVARAWNAPWGIELSCHDPDGAVGSIAPLGGDGLVFVSGTETSTVAMPMLRGATGAGDAVYALAGTTGQDVHRVGVAGDITPVGTLPDPRGGRTIAVSRDGFQLAVLVGPEPFEPTLGSTGDGVVVFNTTGGGGRILDLPGVSSAISEIAWVGNDRLALHWGGRVSVFDLHGQFLGDVGPEGTILAATESVVLVRVPAEGPQVMGEAFALVGASAGGAGTPIEGTAGMDLTDGERVLDGVEPSAEARARIAGAASEPAVELPPVPAAREVPVTTTTPPALGTTTSAGLDAAGTAAVATSHEVAAESTIPVLADSPDRSDKPGIDAATIVAVACFVLAGGLVMRAVLPLVWRRR